MTVASATVRRAAPADAAKIATAVAELLGELGGKPTDEQALAEEARTIAADENAGVLLVAEADGEIVGFLGVSWQRAVRIPGRYGLIQELWVHPDWRSRTIGAELLSGLTELCRRDGVGRVEVGLPGERFPELAATTSFYEANGFTAVGLRMRLMVGQGASDGR